MNETKICTVCKTEYPATSEYFRKDKNQKDGLYYSCINCYKKYYIKNKDHIIQKCKEYRTKNKEQISQYNKEYYIKHTNQFKEYRIKNREHILERGKEYTQKNKDRILQERKEYYIKNKEKIAQRKKELHLKNKDQDLERCRAYHANNKKNINERKKQYRINHPELFAGISKKHYSEHKEQYIQYYLNYKETEKGKLIRLRCSEKRRALKKALPATLTVSEWGCIKDYFNNRCAYCGKEKPLHQDHFIALNKKGEYSHNNIIPACKSCNISKSDKSFFVWYLYQDFYSKAREKKILKFLNYYEQNQQLRLFV